MSNSAQAAQVTDERRLTEIANIFAAGILRLRERQSLPSSCDRPNSTESSGHRLELSSESLLSVVQGG
jgi:hypothetical protein